MTNPANLPQPGSSIAGGYVYALNLQVDPLTNLVVEVVNPIATAATLSFGLDGNGNETISYTNNSAASVTQVLGSAGAMQDATAFTYAAGGQTYIASNIALQNLTSVTIGGLTVEVLPSGALSTTQNTYHAPCYLRGTRILTPAGEVAVEDLRAGDAILTAAGQARAVRWIGERRLDCRRHPEPARVQPVRVRAEAFAAGQPHRDLFLSPDHAVFVDGVLIPVQALLNGRTIVQEAAATAHYFHVELDSHDILLAEGLPAESYLDTGNRRQFANGGAATSLHADFAALDWSRACAPLVTDDHRLERVRRRLAARAARLADGAEAELVLRLAGRTLRPAGVRRGVHSFLVRSVEAEAGAIEVVPRAGITVCAALIDGRPARCTELRLTLPRAPAALPGTHVIELRTRPLAAAAA